jgi:hypothetical protein
VVDRLASTSDQYDSVTVPSAGGSASRTTSATVHFVDNGIGGKSRCEF